MIRQKVRVMNSTGLHARPAATLAKIVKKYQSSLTLVNNDKEIPIKGMMSILGAGVKGNTMIEQTIGKTLIPAPLARVFGQH